MKIKNLELLKKNTKDFDLIINTFFSKKHLSISNYYPIFCEFTKVLRKKIKELKPILDENQDVEELYIYIESLIKKIEKKDINYLQNYKYFLKKKHYYNILEYLKKEKESPKFEIVIYEKFFLCVEDIVYDYFFMKHRIDAKKINVTIPKEIKNNKKI